MTVQNREKVDASHECLSWDPLEVNFLELGINDRYIDQISNEVFRDDHLNVSVSAFEPLQD